MSSKINPYNIDPTFPVFGINQSTQGFRSNFLGIQNNFIETINELTDLTNKCIVSSPLIYGQNNSNINNFGGMPINNVVISNFGLLVQDHGTISSSQTETFDFTQGYYHKIDIEGSGSTIVVNPVNFPNLGYSEFIIDVSTTNAPQYINFNNLSVGENIFVGSGCSSYNTVSNIFTLTSNNIPYHITLGSIDGVNWELSIKNNGGVAKLYTASSSLGSIGDTSGIIAYNSSYLYVCTGNYDGITNIWKRIPLTSF